MGTARTNSAAPPVCSAKYYMVEACSLPLQAMLIAPAPGMQQVNAACKQLVAFSHKPHLSAGPPKRASVSYY